jgi:hypothetical protein
MDRYPSNSEELAPDNHHKSDLGGLPMCPSSLETQQHRMDNCGAPTVMDKSLIEGQCLTSHL